MKFISVSQFFTGDARQSGEILKNLVAQLSILPFLLLTCAAQAGGGELWACKVRGISTSGSCDVPYSCFPFFEFAEGGSEAEARANALAVCGGVRDGKHCAVEGCAGFTLPMNGPESRPPSNVRILASDIVRTAEKAPGGTVGRFVAKTQREASELCAGLGKRLPTVREMAEHATMDGGRIRGTYFPKVGITSSLVDAEIRFFGFAGFSPIYERLGDGRLAVDFYYSSAKFRFFRNGPGSESEIWNGWFWSSSDAHSPILMGYKHVFGAASGTIGLDDPGREFPVLCVTP